MTNDAQDKQIRVTGSASCNGESVSKTLPTPGWQADVRLCGGATDSGGCGGGQNCIADAPSGFAGVCVFRVGDHPCPSGYSTSRAVYHEDFTDTRDCTGCTCTPSNWNCSTTMTRYQTSNCTGSTSSTYVSSSSPKCSNGLNMTAFTVSPVAKTSGACGVTSNTTLTGTVTPAKPQTVCCR